MAKFSVSSKRVGWNCEVKRNTILNSWVELREAFER